jgi:hypothetical protein
MRHLAKSVWILPGWKKRLPFSSYRTFRIFLRTNLTRVPLVRKDHLVRWSFFLCVLCIFISTHFRARSVMVPGLGLAVRIRVGTDNPNQS